MAVRGVYTKAEEKMLSTWRERAEKLTGWLGETPSEDVPYPVFHRVASRDLILHMAYAADYHNPLWRDEDYARNTRWGGIIAPPFFEHCITHGGPNFPLIVPPEVGFPRMGMMSTWEFFKPIYINDSFKVWVNLPKLEDETGSEKPTSRRFKIIESLSFINQRDELVAVSHRTAVITILPHKVEAKKSAVKFTDEYRYTQEDIEAIDSFVDAEERRGPRIRYWEDVNVGDELQPVAKGPITVWDMVVEMQGFGIAILPMIEVRRQTPERVMIDPITNIPHKSIEFHLTERGAQLRDSYSTTLIAVSVEHFFGRLITNWMGDDGFLKGHSYRKLSNQPLGDTIFGRGRVTKKYIDSSGDYVVDLDVWMESVRGFIANVATATVSLLSKEKVFE